MAEPTVTSISRRASYGPGSPTIGARGARTRQAILDAALQHFADSGFAETSVDDIASTAGVSRATVYQYFESREQMVVELLEECGAALMRVVRRLGTLGPTAEGYDNLHWWLGEWGYVYDKYATMFIEWAHIDTRGHLLRPLITTFVEGYTQTLAERIAAAAVTGLDPSAIAIALMTVIERFNYYSHTQDPGFDPATALDTLAITVQLVLFPATPRAAFVSSHEATPSTRGRVPVSRRVAAGTPHVVRRDDELSEVARRSIEKLLAAGARVFADNGYRGSSVDQILTTAGLSRRTFYKYFGNRLDLLVVLSDRAALAASDLATRFPSSADGVAPQAWLTDLLAFQEVHGGVLRIWIEEPISRAVQHTGDAALAELVTAFTRVTGQRRRPAGYDPVCAAWLLLALLERLPHQGVGTRFDLSPGDLVETITAFVRRGFGTVLAKA